MDDFSSVTPGTVAVSPDGSSIAVRQDEDWVVIDPYRNYTDNFSVGDWIVKYSPDARRG